MPSDLKLSMLLYERSPTLYCIIWASFQLCLMPTSVHNATTSNYNICTEFIDTSLYSQAQHHANLKQPYKYAQHIIQLPM
jgi:hypothetical protein